MSQKIEMDIATYLLNFCDQLEAALPDDVYSCKIYGGELENDSTDYINFNVNKKAQSFIALREIKLDQGRTLLGNATFIVAVAVLTDRKTEGFSLAGMEISQKIAGFINGSDCLNEGTAGRPVLEDILQITNKIKDKKMYNIFHIVYNQRIILKQDYN